MDLVTLMEDIARAIRMKHGFNEKINAQDFPQKIKEIPQQGSVGDDYEEIYNLLSNKEADPNAEQSLLELANKLIGGDEVNG